MSMRLMLADGVREELARDLWKTVWRAERQRRNGISVLSSFEASDRITDSMLIGHALDMTPRQIFDLIQCSRWLLSEREAAPQQNMLQYKLACRNGEIGVGFDEELPF